MTKIFTQVLLFLTERFILNEIGEGTGKISLPTTAFKEDTECPALNLEKASVFGL